MRKGRKWEDSVRRLLLKFRQEVGVEPRGRQCELEEMLAGQDPRCELPAWAFAPSPMRRVHLCPMLSPSSLPRTSAFQTLLATTWFLPCCCPPPKSWSDPLQNQAGWCRLCNTVVSILWELREKKTSAWQVILYVKNNLPEARGNVPVVPPQADRYTCLPADYPAFRHPGSSTWLHKRSKNALSPFRKHLKV